VVHTAKKNNPSGSESWNSFVILAILWFFLTEANLSSWLVGLPCILAAVVAYRRTRLSSGFSIRLKRLPAFSAWFLWHSLKGGIDVAWRAAKPRVRLDPGFINYPLTLPPGQARTFLVNVVSLLPGTLSADVEGNALVLHTLDMTVDTHAEIDEAERRVTSLYGIDRRVTDA